MPFEPGQSGNPAGRPKGAVNRTSKELRELITNFLFDNFEQIQQCFDQLKPKDKVKTWCSMLSFAVPKLKAISDDIFDMMTEDQVEDLFERLKAEVERQFAVP